MTFTLPAQTLTSKDLKILFLDQSGGLGGAELCLLDTATPYRHQSLVALFADGAFRTALEQHNIPVQVLAPQGIQVRKQTSWLGGLAGFVQLIPIILQVAKLAKQYDLIYANTQKALVVGAIASKLSQQPLVYHLHDILSADHFSRSNLQIAVTFANQFADLIIANSQASRTAFLQAGGKAKNLSVIYNGFAVEQYQQLAQQGRLRQADWKRSLGLENHFVVGHFSRLSPWKGQHILIDAIAHCPEHVAAVLVGDALFGETEYVQQLHHQVEQWGLHDRVKFLGFQTEIPQLMAQCDLIAHTSTAPEPFGRVIVEAMLCETPVVAAAGGGALELVQPEHTGWLTPPGDEIALAHIIQTVYKSPTVMESLAKTALETAKQQFSLEEVIEKIDQSLKSLLSKR